VVGEEADESQCKAVALCADLEVFEHEDAIVVVKDAVHRITVVDIVVEDAEVDAGAQGGAKDGGAKEKSP
jgi:ferredoxin